MDSYLFKRKLRTDPKRCVAKGSAAQAVLELADAEYLAGKTVIDTSNPIADLPPNNGVLHYSTSFDL